jgi:RHS repeat-associated protein
MRADPVANPLHMVEEDNSYTDWGYDNIYRLTSDVKTGGSSYSRTFSYDAVGNRTQMVKDQQTTNYTYDANNKMTAAGGDNYTYDANDNTIGRTGSSGNATWGYDYENRIVSSTTPQGSATLTYNGDGLRVRKVEAGVTRNYLFDGVRVYSEHDSNMVEQARFMIEGDSYYDPLVAQRIGETWYYPLYDALGSTRRLVNAAQSITDSYSYEAFGGITAQSGSTYNPYKYVGSLGYNSSDTTTGLSHLGARYYNPTVGRFSTPDPVYGVLHLYRYAPNPLRYADPAGELDPITGAAIAVLAGGGILYDIVQGRFEGAAKHQGICDRARKEAALADCPTGTGGEGTPKGQFRMTVSYPGTLFWPPLHAGRIATHTVTWMVRRVRKGSEVTGQLHALWTDIDGNRHDENCGTY